jgi:hypothetical protein
MGHRDTDARLAAEVLGIVAARAQDRPRARGGAGYPDGGHAGGGHAGGGHAGGGHASGGRGSASRGRRRA